MTLTGLSEGEVRGRIKNGRELPINFETECEGQKIPIKAEGLSLKEYEIFQRIFFEKHKKHLDEKDWTWLLKAFSVSRVVVVHWLLGARQFVVYVRDPSNRLDDLCLRLSRSFSN